MLTISLNKDSIAVMNVDALLNDTAARYGASTDAVRALWDALVRGNGTMAQFSHSELGGSGQWMAGGMTMVGDMFNYGLKAKVDGICGALSGAAQEASRQFYSGNVGSFQSQSQGSGNNFAYSNSNQRWWPENLGAPNSVGSQNDLQYAYFSGPRRLVVNRGGNVTVYDTLNHSIGGVSQQQGGYDSLTFTSQFGTIRVSELPVVQDANQSTNFQSSNELSQDQVFEFTVGNPNPPQSNFAPPPINPAPMNTPAPVPQQSSPAPTASTPSGEDPMSLLEKLGKLRDAGILTDEEFAAKKAELLKRI